MGGGIPGHPLNSLGGVDKLFHLGVALVGLPQGLGQLQRVLQADVLVVGAAGNLLGQGVHLAVGDPQHPAHVPDGPPRRHGAECNDLGHVVRAVFPIDIINHFPPALVAEVDVDIRHGHPFRV